SWPILRRTAVVTLAIARVFPVEDKSVMDGFGELGEAAEIHEEAFTLAGQERIKRVVKVIVPLRVESEASLGTGINDPNIIKIALGDQPRLTIQALGLSLKRF